MNTLTTYYCAFCDAIVAFFTGLVPKASYNRKTYNQLSVLSDYELKDIGLCRGDIMHIAKGGTVYRGRHLAGNYR